MPADLRALMDAKPGARRVWSAMPDGTIIVRAKRESALDMAGMLEAHKGNHVSVDDMTAGAQVGTCMPALDSIRSNSSTTVTKVALRWFRE